MNNELECAHSAYRSNLFDDSFSGNHRQFWKYIWTRRKDSSGISLNNMLLNPQFCCFA